MAVVRGRIQRRRTRIVDPLAHLGPLLEAQVADLVEKGLELSRISALECKAEELRTQFIHTPGFLLPRVRVFEP